MKNRTFALAAGVVVLAVAVAVGIAVAAPHRTPPVNRAIGFADILPAPVSAIPTENESFTLVPGAAIIVPPDAPQAAQLGDYVSALVGGAAPRSGTDRVDGGIAMILDAGVAPDGAYNLTIETGGVTIRAGSAAGLFWGVQTLRQLMPPLPGHGPLTIPAGRVADAPRFAYRGAMLDVARHFFGVPDVQRYIDLISMYKINYLHLHLSDDQGWRIAIDGWPRLTDYGASTATGGDAGGFYTQDDYRQIVSYAAARFITVVPEIDLPGHTNAALASYADLNCGGAAPPLYTGFAVGFSALCPTKDATYQFLDDVFGELARLTPGPYLHIGGDEARTLSDHEYADLVTRAQQIVASHGKKAVGWHELAAASPAASTVLQFWDTNPFQDHLVAAARAGNRVIMSPADHAYLDQKYASGDPIGLSWAGPTTVERSYAWDPASYVSGLPESAVLGVEAPLWTETVRTMNDIEYLAFPRLAGIAEIGWSPVSTHDWGAYRNRLGAQAPRWVALGVDFARVDDVPWVAAP